MTLKCRCTGYTNGAYHMTWCPCYRKPWLDVNPATYFLPYGRRA